MIKICLNLGICALTNFNNRYAEVKLSFKTSSKSQHT